jgi:hypothetical protein
MTEPSNTKRQPTYIDKEKTMKRFLILLLLLPVALLAAEAVLSAGGSVTSDAGPVAITIAPEPATEDELMSDNGVVQYRWTGGIAGFASYFEAPYDCYLVRVKMICYNSSARNYYIDVLGEDSGTAGKPDRSDSLIGGYQTFADGGGSGDRWVEFELDTPLLLSSGDVFFPMTDDSIDELDNAPQDTQAPGPANSAWWWQNSDFSDMDVLGAMMIRAIVDDDMDGPYSANQDPAPGETGVAGDTDILFDIVDDDKGTDGTTIMVEVEEVDVTADCTITDNGDGSFSVEYDPPSDFTAGQVVNVNWEADDGLGNYGSDEWSFTISDSAVVDTTWGTIKNLE